MTEAQEACAVRDEINFGLVPGGELEIERTICNEIRHSGKGHLDHVVTELRTAQPVRQIDSDIQLTGAIHCDPARLAQLLSNLLANALTHGDPRGPESVRARNDSGLEISVSNRGKPIEPETLKRLFLPFERGAGKSGSQGLGLGLYTASEIARAHGATLEADSDGAETRFTFRIPPA